MSDNIAQLPRLSAQQLIDCARTESDTGCGGGTIDGAFEYIKNKGLVQAGDYPHGLDGEQHICARATLNAPVFNASRSVLLVPSCLGAICPPNLRAEHVLLDHWRDTQLVAAHNGKPFPQPMVAYVDAGNWAEYSGGIFPASQCSSAGTDLMHIVQIVGYGTDGASGKPFWKIRNSWGLSLRVSCVL